MIRAALVPLTFRQLKSMQEMQRLAPQIQALKEKYKDDKQRQQQEIMGSTGGEQDQPAGLLPTAASATASVHLAVLHVAQRSEEAHLWLADDDGLQPRAPCPRNPEQVHRKHQLSDRGAAHSAKFLFLPDITNKATGAALIVLIVLYVGSQLASTLVATATADPNQRRLMLLLPVVFVVILYRYPAGLLVYWITTNMWTIVQQLLIRRHMDASKQPAPGEARRRAGDGGLAQRQAGPSP